MPNIGPTELIVVLIIALLVFGPKRLPEIGRTVGKSLREFRQATNSIRDEMDMGLKDYDEPPTTDAKPPVEPGLASTNGSGSGESEARLIAEGEGGTSAPSSSSSPSSSPPEPTTDEPGRSP